MKKKISKNKLIILLALIFIVICGLVVAYNNKTNIMSMIGARKDAILSADYSEYEEIGENAYISSATITDTATGVGPWDDDDEPGNDSSADNNIVRSFDQITWTVENTFSLKDGTNLTESYTGGVICIEASVPTELANLVEWDLDSMTWAENAEVSDDGTEFTAYYTMTNDEKTVPGKQNLVMILQVYNAVNETEIIPTFNVSLYGNDEDDVKTIIGDTIYVSAVPSYNIQLSRNTSTNYRSYFDLVSGQEVDSLTDTSVYGRMQGYGITIQLYNSSSDKGLKGIELPSGEITFDITFNESIGTNDVTNEEGYTPILWDYKENTSSNSGKNGYNMYWNYNNSTRYAYLAAPYNTGANSYSCYNGGTWSIEQDNIESNVYHVTITGYSFDLDDFEFPTRNVSDANSTVRYSANVGSFSAGYIQAIMQMPETVTSGATSIYMKATISNFNATSSSGTTTTEDAKSSDDMVNTSITLYPAGSYDKYNFFYEAGTNNNMSWQTGNLASTYTSGDSKITTGENVIIAGRITNSSSNDDNLKSVNILQKFDDKAFEPLETSTTSSGYMSVKVINSYDKGTLTVLYAAKPDGTGWTDDEEMEETRENELIYFKSMAELKEAGYTCVGVLFENRDCTLYPGAEIYYGITVQIKDTAEIETVYQTVNDAKVWTNDIDFSWQDQTYTIDESYTLTYNEYDYPSSTWSMVNGQSTSHPKYIKTQYDENGQIVTGTHNGAHSGQSILVVGAEQSISIVAIGSDGNEKTNYDLGKNEDTAKYEVTPQIASANTSNQIENITLSITVTLPEGLTYIAGTSERNGTSYSEPVVTENGDGTTTLVWYIYGCTSGKAITPITFETQINNESENGKQYEVEAVIAEYVADGDASKLGNSEVTNRTYSYDIQIINLSSYSFYKTTETPVIEVNGVVHYKLTILNKTDDDVTDFQLLDILPYNGDSRGTSYHGTYTVNSIEITQTNTTTSTEITDNILNLYVTNSTSVRSGVTAKDTDLGTSSIWSSETAGETIGEELTAYAVIGTLQARSRLEIDIYLQTADNEPYDLYKNSATAQTNTETEVMETSIITVQDVKRTIEGYVWLDENRDGLITDGEEYLSGVTVTLVAADGSPAVDVSGNVISSTTTDEYGYYSFEDMIRADYIVQFESAEEIEGVNYEFTEKEVGSNVQINSKVSSTGQTDTITTLNSIDSPVITESYVNAGIKMKDAEITDKEITKEGNIDTITQEDQSITYDIEYTETLEDYIGNATITIVDSLPYEIEDDYEYNITLNGNSVSLNTDAVTYDEDNKTITFEIPVEDINTYGQTDEKYVITVNVELTVTYIGVNYGDTSITNRAKGNIYLEETEQTDETEEVEETTPINIDTEVAVTKIWQDWENEYSTRPSSITINLLQNGTPIQSATVTSSNNWAYTFANLDKYDASGTKYVYTITEDSVEGYTTELDGYSVTNTSTKPLVSVEKVASITENAKVGDTILYTIKVSNAGYVELTDISLMDEIATSAGNSSLAVYADENCTDGNEITSISSLAVGEAVTVYTKYTVTQDDIDNQVTIVNTITATDGTTTDTDTAETTVEEAAPQIEVEKTANKTQNAKVNDEITYTINITNTGNVTLTNVRLTDELTKVKQEPEEVIESGIAGILYTDKNCTDGNEITNILSLAVGETVTVYAKYTITQDDIDNQTVILNTVYATDGNVEDTDTASTTPEGIVLGIAVEKTADKTVDAKLGDEITYTINVTNTGNATLTNVDISDVVGDEKLTIYADESCTTGNEISAITKIPVGETVTVYAKYTVTQDDIDNQVAIVNTVTAKAGSVEDTDTAETLPEVADPQIEVEKTADITENAKVNDEITYTINVTNTGNVTLSEIKLLDEITKVKSEIEENSTESVLSVTLYTDQDCTEGNEITEIEKLSVGETKSVYAKYTVTQDDIDNQVKIVNTVYATDGNVEDTDTAETTVEEAAPQIEVEKTADKTENAVLGDEITYTINVTNTGNVTLTNVKLSDVVGESSLTLYTDQDCTDGNEITEISTLSVGETKTVYAKYTVTQDDIDNQVAIVNTVYVTDGNVEDTDTAQTTPKEYSPEFKVEKTADKTKDVGAGETIVYTINITNTGYVTLKNVGLSDIVSTSAGEIALTVYNDKNCSAGNEVTTIERVEVGETKTVYAKYTVTQDDIDNQVKITNTITATVGEQSDKDTAETTVEETNLSIGVSKAASIQSGAKEGNTILYTISVTNKGNTTLSNISLSDVITISTGESNLTLYTDKNCTTGNEITQISSLAVGETKAVYTKYTVTSSDVAQMESIVNMVTVATGEISASAKVVTTLTEETTVALPKTGGLGPLVYEVVGVILCTIGVILLAVVIKKKKANDK